MRRDKRVIIINAIIKVRLSYCSKKLPSSPFIRHVLNLGWNFVAFEYARNASNTSLIDQVTIIFTKILRKNEKIFQSSSWQSFIHGCIVFIKEEHIYNWFRTNHRLTNRIRFSGKIRFVYILLVNLLPNPYRALICPSFKNTVFLSDESTRGEFLLTVWLPHFHSGSYEDKSPIFYHFVSKN